MSRQTTIYFILFICNFLLIKTNSELQIDPHLTQIWGPGLTPQDITMPARYFFIQTFNSNNESISKNPGEIFQVIVEGISKLNKLCRIWSNNLNRKDGSFIIRYKLYEPCISMKISVKYEDFHVGQSPYNIKESVYSDDCNCPKTIANFLELWECGAVPDQIEKDLNPFQSFSWDLIRQEVIDQWNNSDSFRSVSVCHYIIKDNSVFRNCYGKYVGFKMFMDSILLSLTRKVTLPNLEFFVNLGDWPLAKGKYHKYPIFSWCGSTKTKDIVMPTYDITESTLENMGRVMLDMLSVQGNVKEEWNNRIPKAFWRGRDSNQHRLDLIDISRKNPELFNVSLTNFFFFRDKEQEYGPRAEHVSFFDFFNYKYQLGIDGTVAAYRFPYLLAGGSLVFKQDSPYYEHFYNDLEPFVHYIPIKNDLEDLVSQINKAIETDDKSREIATNGKKYANENLLPKNIFCYYTQLLNEFSKRITSEVHILPDMEKVEQIKEQTTYCDCKLNLKDEL